MTKTQKILIGVIVVLAIALASLLIFNTFFKTNIATCAGAPNTSTKMKFELPDNKETNKISGPIGSSTLQLN